MLEHLLVPETRDFNLTFLEDTNITIREILTQVDLYPVMAERRVVVVRDAPFFKVQQRTVPITIVRNAFKIETTNPQKSISTLAKLLEVSPYQIAENDFNYINAVNSLIDELSTKLTDEERGFLKRLPQIAQQLDTYATAEPNDTGDVAVLLNWLQGALPKHSVLIFTVQGPVNQRNQVVKAIEAVGRYRSFDPVEAGSSLNRDPLYKKVSDKFTEYGKQITPRAFSLLRTRTGGDMHTIAESINKIVNFVGDKRQVDEQDVRNMVTQNTFDSIFDLTDAIGKRSVGQAVKSLHEVLASGLDPIQINAMIIRQLRFMLQAKLVAKEKEIRPLRSRMRFSEFTKSIFEPLAEDMVGLLPKSPADNILKQKPYVAYKIFQVLNAFTVENLVRALDRVLEAEVELKTGVLDPTYVLEQGRLKVFSPVKAKALNTTGVLEQLVCDLCAISTERRSSSR